MRRRYRLAYTYRTWKREPASPFATAVVVFDDPSAAHEYGLKLKNQGHINIVIEPYDDIVIEPYDADVTSNPTRPT